MTKKFCKNDIHDWVRFSYVVKQGGMFARKEYLEICRNCEAKRWNAQR